MPVHLCPLPDYRATRVRSLTLYRQRIAELFDFERARARLEHGAVDAVAREIDLTARRRALA